MSMIVIGLLLFLTAFRRCEGLCYQNQGYGCNAGQACLDANNGDYWFNGNCVQCPPGYYCPGGKITSKKTAEDAANPAQEFKCPIGRANPHSSSSSSTACVACVAGKYAAALASPTCSACEDGYIAGSTGSSACIPCEVGKISDDATSCSKCTKGKYASVAGSTDCALCPKGKYTALESASSCDVCPQSKYSENEGVSTCSDCSAGKYTDITGASSQTECMKCPWGTYNPAAGNTCRNCPAGTSNVNTGSTSSDDCVPCPAGRSQAGTGKNFCQQCSADTYQPNSGMDTCVGCAVGRTSAPGATGCVKASTCKAGTYYSTTKSQCLTCAAGSFAGDGATTCSKCESNDNGNTTTSLPGSKSAADCFIVCPKGYFAGASGRCEGCNPGSYNNQEGQPRCTACTEGKFQEERGQQACLECARGTYSMSMGSPVCQFCPAGKYGVLLGAASEDVCIDCDAGFYSFIGSTMCKKAPPGSFTNVSSSKEYISCAPGRYQPDSGTKTCLITNPGYYTGAFAAVQLPCPSGTANGLQGATSKADCLPCDEGAVSNVGSANCTSCQGKDMIPNKAQSACIVDTASLFSRESIIEELVQKGVALMVAGSMAALYVLVAALVQYRREKYTGAEGFEVGAVPRLMVVVKSFISGLIFGSEVFLVAAMMTDAPKLASTMIAFRCLHAALCSLFSVALFGGSGWMKTVENFGISDARNLYKQMDLGFVSAHVPLVGALVLLSCADVDLVPLWPWKASAFHTESQGYPNMNVMTRSLTANAVQSIVSMVCQIIYLSSTHDESTSSNQARALFAFNITFTSIGVTIGMLSLFLKKGILLRMEKERLADGERDRAVTGAEKGYTKNPMIGGGGTPNNSSRSLETVQSDNPIVQEILKVLRVDARLEEEKASRIALEEQNSALKRQLNGYAAKVQIEEQGGRPSEFEMSMEDVYGGEGGQL